MRTYPKSCAGVARALRHSGLLVLSLVSLQPAEAQERRYLFEVSAGGGYYGFGETADLSGSFGGVGRIGVWLPYNFSLEAEGFVTSPDAKQADASVKVTGGFVSALYNQFLGGNSWGYAKLGLGQTKYGGECVGQRICGTPTTFLAGVGTRIALTPILLIRAEAALQPNRGNTVDRNET